MQGLQCYIYCLCSQTFAFSHARTEGPVHDVLRALARWWTSLSECKSRFGVCLLEAGVQDSAGAVCACVKWCDTLRVGRHVDSAGLQPLQSARASAACTREWKLVPKTPKVEWVEPERDGPYHWLCLCGLYIGDLRCALMWWCHTSHATPSGGCLLCKLCCAYVCVRRPARLADPSPTNLHNLLTQSC